MKPIRQHRKTHCPVGHPYDETNAYITSQGLRLCRACTRERAYRWYLAHRDPEKPHRRQFERKYNKHGKYGLTLEAYAAMLLSQDNRCASCNDEFSDDSRPQVDHDHRCCPKGKSCGRCVRGLLCKYCNRMLGHAKDDPARLAAGQRYLASRPLL